MRLFRKNKRTVLAILLLVFVLGLFFVPYVYNNRLSIIRTPLAAHFIPLYRSLRKLPDLLFFPVTLLTKSNLETFELSIRQSDIQAMNRALPQNPFGDEYLDEEYKKWVPANFFASDYSGNVKVRYRGNQNGHWNSYQKSYLVKFPKDKLFRGMRELTLIIASDRRYFTTALNNYRANKLGLIVPDLEYVKVGLNGADHGVYIALEHWSQEWMEKVGIEPSSILFGMPDVTELDAVRLYSKEGIMYWKSWNVKDQKLILEPAKAISEIVEYSDKDTFKKIVPQIIDLDSFYSRDILGVLAGGFHWSNNVDANNIIFYFDTIEGRFKPIPFNISLFETPGGIFSDNSTDLQKRIWEIPEFRNERSKKFNLYIKNNKNDDLLFLQKWEKTMNKEFLKDNAKADNNFSYLRKVKKFKELVIKYLENPYDEINGVKDLSTRDKKRRGDLVFEGSFKYLTDTIVNSHEFVKLHPEFVLQGGSIVLPSGSYFFPKTIIIPVDTKLVISLGTTLFMGESSSIISYSPVEALGNASNPIRFLPANGEKPWGVFAVINTENKESRFSNLYITGGKDATINGVYYSGMLSLYNSDGEIRNSIFENANADDGVNIKRGRVTVEGNTFNKNSSDALDIDFARDGSTVSLNRFFDNDGDAIDLSWSAVLIDRNIIVGCGDKGVSVGEKSNPTISKNVIARCGTGIASKDSSRTEASDNTLIGNNIAISAYQKKPIFGGGAIDVTGGVLWDNVRDTRIDGFSTVTLSGVATSAPDLSRLPSFVRKKILQ